VHFCQASFFEYTHALTACVIPRPVGCGTSTPKRGVVLKININEYLPTDAGGAGAERGGAAPASALPCLFVTTASEEEKSPLPGPRKKQADALTENIKWMTDTFGKERIGFLTLTLGDQRPRQPIHVHAKVMQSPQKHIR
jgi:hypothetical protein